MSILVATTAAAAGARRRQGTPPFATLEDPPAMTVNPVTFTDVLPGEAGWPTQAQMAGRDVKIVLPTDRIGTAQGIIAGFEANPIHNLWVVGGEIASSATGGAVLTVLWWSGTAFFEGLELDALNAEADGIRCLRNVGSVARVVIQNSRIRGMAYGDIVHGDMFHSQGTAGTAPAPAELVMQNCRGELLGQGIFVPERADGHGVRRMVLDHVELVLDPRFSRPDGMGNAIYASNIGAGNMFPTNGQSYHEVWLNWWDPHYPGTEDEPNHATPAAVRFDEDDFAVFSAQDIIDGKIEGAWRRGNPPSTFVPLDKIGRNYDRSFFTGRG